MRAIRISRWGGPEVLELDEDAPMPVAGDGQVLVKVNRAGVNFADTHARDNTYLSRYELPLIPGAEVAGTTEDGQHVVALTATGGYAEYAAVPAATTFPIPDGVSDAQALAVLLQGLTAWHLYKTSAKLAQGESVGLLGPNGAGKTTSFYMIVGLIRPDRGKVYIGNRELTGVPMYRRARLGN